MPSNRRAQPEAEKRAELISAACDLFVQDGYDTTPMNRIAQKAGVTPNTIYWYFKDKDELLLAVLDTVLQEDLKDYSLVAQSPLTDQLMWLVERLSRVSTLMSTLHTRIRVSPALDEWHNRFHALMEQLLVAQLPGPFPVATRDAEIRIISFALEGMVSHQEEPVMVRKMCEALAARCIAISQHAL
ncbi:MAG TPA: helix-turn-helix domain-containing protein [Dongiaceae bacterium]|nr:helix-turn-helix domain-containing protein [Dongiaceae bacterium]